MFIEHSRIADLTLKLFSPRHRFSTFSTETSVCVTPSTIERQERKIHDPACISSWASLYVDRVQNLAMRHLPGATVYNPEARIV